MAETGKQAGGGRAYGAGIAIALVASLVTTWTTIVRDDGNGLGFLAVVMTAGVVGFATHFRPADMARGMFGVAIMQVLIAVAVATAPSTASLPGGAIRIAGASGIYTGLWLMSALCFGASARGEREAAAAR